jgi:ribosomal protein S18 acetylase RimI-like enzyme
MPAGPGAPDYSGAMTRSLVLDDATVRAIERHETAAHALPAREVRDLGDALVLFDPRDPDPFWNRMVSVRWPAGAAAFDRRLAEAMALFSIRGRTPHVWPSPVHTSPPDLVERLAEHGFRDIGGGHVMVLPDPSSTRPVLPAELDRGVTLAAIRRAADAGPDDVVDVAEVLVAGFDAEPGRAVDLADDLHATLDDPRVTLVLVRVDGEAAAVAKATSMDGFTYLSSIATRPAYRGRGLASLATRHAIVTGGGRTSRLAYLGVWSGNAPAIRLYERLGFATLGEAPDLLLG